MSREIDLDGPLSDKDRQYLLDRGREGLVAEIDRANGVGDAPRETDPFGNPIDEGMTGDVGFDSELSGHTDTITDRTERQTLEGQGMAGAGNVLVGDVAEAVPPYSEWTPAALKAELGVRELDTSGRKAELVARLELDDEADGE